MKLYVSNENPSIVKAYYDNDFQMQEMKKFLTIKIPGAKYTKMFRAHQWDGSKSFYNRWNNSFPIGFLYRVMKQFAGVVQLMDQREYKPIKFCMPKLNELDEVYKSTGKAMTLRMYQKESILYAFEHKNCMIQSATNSGKSAVIAALATMLREEGVVIVVHRVELLWQLRKMLMGMTGLNVGYVSAEEVNLDPRINIVMVMTLLNRLDVDQALEQAFFGSKVLIVDEAHHMKSATHQAVFAKSKAVYRFGCSGTIADEDTYDGWLMRQYIGDVVYNISNKELIDQGVSAEPIINMIKMPHAVNYTAIIAEIREDNDKKGKKFESPWREKEEVYKKVFAKVLQKHIVENGMRNAVVVDKVTKDYKNKQILIVVDFLEHGRRLEAMLWERIKLITGKDDLELRDMDFIHGTSESRTGSLAKFRKGTLRVLISSSIIDEGIDISRIEVLILAAGKKSRRQILQRIGRGLRRKEGENVVHILDFYDFDGKYLEKHSKERLKLYNKEKFRVEIVESDVNLAVDKVAIGMSS
jgi:superfamily II DNA or RNA helicase